jgi:hypothetical protein
MSSRNARESCMVIGPSYFPLPVDRV